MDFSQAYPSFFAFSFMIVMWFWGKTRNNYAVIDVGWGLVIAGIATVYSILGTGNLLSKLSVLVPVWFWAIRLSGYLYITRIRTNHPEDKRYAKFREDYGDKVHQKFFTNVFLLQGFLALLLSPPFVVAANANLDLSVFQPFVFIGLALFILGVIGESIADNQLHRFVSNSANKGMVCNIGLWNYSRHPNYFFEWLLWLGIGIIPIQIQNTNSLLSLFSPLVMFILLRFVSGVPFAERFSLLSKGEKFVAYQKTTNAFFPWFPKAS